MIKNFNKTLLGDRYYYGFGLIKPFPKERQKFWFNYLLARTCK
jgi:hypothetical protein